MIRHPLSAREDVQPVPRTTARPAKKAATPARAAAKTTTKKAAAPTKKGVAKKETAAKKAAKKATGSRSPAKPAAKEEEKEVEKAPAAKVAPSNSRSASTSTRKTAAKKAPAKKASAKKAAGSGKAPAKKSPYGSKFLAAQEALLRHERATYFRQFESLQAEADALVADFESGDVQFDEESGEGDTINIERERDLALSAQARQAVEEIDHALAKIKAGTYGLCETSGEPIPKDRLEAIPWARERVEYKIGGFGRR